LIRNGIPSSWIRVETFRSTDGNGTQRLHPRLVLREWHPRLMDYLVPLENDFLRRVKVLDYRCGEWLGRCSWQFDLLDASMCPPLPRAGSWTAEPRALSPATDLVPPIASGDVIAGPVLIASIDGGGSHELDRLLAQGDRQHAGAASARHYAKTRPASL
jgi:hypothetical protein